MLLDKRRPSLLDQRLVGNNRIDQLVYHPRAVFEDFSGPDSFADTQNWHPSWNPEFSPGLLRFSRHFLLF